MTDLEPILSLWRELEAAGSDYVLASVVGVEGSSYRKPGAHMLLAEDGRRAGTVSGGCLEAEVARRAWWLTEAGPRVERYSTTDDDGERPYGSGCGGVVHLLLERPKTAGPLLKMLAAAFESREALGVATVLEGPQAGARGFFHGAGGADANDSLDPLGLRVGLRALAQHAYELATSTETPLLIEGVKTRVRMDYCAPRPGLWVFSAGDDARPLVRMARELGWFVVVADGRSHLVTRERFPEADDVRVLPIAELPGAAPGHFNPRPTDAAVMMTHSFEQDSRVLASLLALHAPPAYMGVLGPQRRTRELLAEAALLLRLAADDERVDAWLAQLHAPTGLDLGAETPAAVALSILAEVQKVLGAASGEPMRLVRAVAQAVAPR
ncbi:MAG TPA: XdhC family protein [Terracidiphilus sp.]|nr:XdhC family protein [Terracidiphilus sp.]